MASKTKEPRGGSANCDAHYASPIRQLGDIKFFDGIGELRIDYGPGYRVYLIQRGSEMIILLCGGDKRTQRKDIVRAKEMAKEIV